MSVPLGPARVESLRAHLRAQYALLVGSVLVLAVTGLPQKLDSTGAGRQVIEWGGGIETLRLVHHVAGGVLVFAGVYHVALVLVAVLALGVTAPLRMVPAAGDARAATRAFRFYLGLTRRAPAPRTPGYFEKADYWLMAWGLAVVAATGLIGLFSLPIARSAWGDGLLTALRLHSDAAPMVAAWVLIVHVYSVGWIPSLFPRGEAALNPAAGAVPPTVSPAPRPWELTRGRGTGAVGVPSHPVSGGAGDPEAGP